jgi:hypothetical protein
MKLAVDEATGVTRPAAVSPTPAAFSFLVLAGEDRDLVSIFE